jgi:hypothetical protein
MKAYHKTCGSTSLGKRPIVIHKGRYSIKTETDVCHHCNRDVEAEEIVRKDRRLFHMHMDK